jgi:hypothetical protein
MLAVGGLFRLGNSALSECSLWSVAAPLLSFANWAKELAFDFGDCESAIH